MTTGDADDASSGIVSILRQELSLVITNDGQPSNATVYDCREAKNDDAIHIHSKILKDFIEAR
ncbi:hypothetical protein [Chryseobacterium sp. ON_d1]|uniref:hypothetical protein n=1 Tax=Chryseobacterium sp. ON_d1 TaxID=2583211 RepID=UPI0011576D7D|nr:hypothetical protein [Chryseobacterium sp. ON_d1]GEJ45878.1 hypothetical protein CRS_24860 [Chryseobacterium sp. ON_d1]